jgi:hypothetical protein
MDFGRRVDDIKAELVRPQIDCRLNRQVKGGLAQRGWIDPEKQVMHDTVANNDYICNVMRADPGRIGACSSQLIEGADHGTVESVQALRLG